MAFCAKCGAQLAAGATFCSSCGASQGAGGGGGSAAGTSGMEENVAALLSYLFGWVTGIIFFVIDKRPFVKFHAAQSMVLCGGLTVLWMVFGVFARMAGFFLLGAVGLLIDVVGLAAFLLCVLCMVKAYQHERFKLPIVGDIAENIAGK